MMKNYLIYLLVNQNLKILLRKIGFQIVLLTEDDEVFEIHTAPIQPSMDLGKKIRTKRLAYCWENI